MARRLTPVSHAASHGGLLAIAALTVATGVARGAEAVSLPCRFATVEHAIVRDVIDGRTLRLSGGGEVRLLGLADLALIGPGNEAAIRTAEAESRAALAALTLGKSILIESPQPGVDRYGQRLALVKPELSGSARPLQEELIAAGHAVVSSRVGESSCAAQFLAAERAARAARLGLWGDPYYQVKQAVRPEQVAASRGRFALVEGKVLSVRDRGAVIYVNFGRRWSEDFTVTISKGNARRFAAAGLQPKALSGHRVRVRGWIDERGGPWIEATDPGQIEFADRP